MVIALLNWKELNRYSAIIIHLALVHINGIKILWPSEGECRSSVESLQLFKIFVYIKTKTPQRHKFVSLDFMADRLINVTSSFY